MSSDCEKKVHFTQIRFLTSSFDPGIHFNSFKMPNTDVITIIDEKKLYLVQLRNLNGAYSEVWLDRAQILFIDPHFFDEAGSSSSANQTTSTAVALLPQDVQQNDNSLQQDDEDVSDLLHQKRDFVHLNIVDDHFYCAHCGKKFHRKDHLKDHIMNLHMGGKKKLHCPECPSMFGYSSNRNQHMARKHKWTSDQIEIRFKNPTGAHVRPKNLRSATRAKKSSSKSKQKDEKSPGRFSDMQINNVNQFLMKMYIHFQLLVPRSANRKSQPVHMFAQKIYGRVRRNLLQNQKEKMKNRLEKMYIHFQLLILP